MGTMKLTTYFCLDDTYLQYEQGTYAQINTFISFQVNGFLRSTILWNNEIELTLCPNIMLCLFLRICTPQNYTMKVYLVHIVRISTEVTYN